MASVNAMKTTSVQRNVVVRAKSGRRTEHESLATNTVDHRRLVGPVDLAAQAAHMDVDEIRLRNEFVIPHLLEQHRTREQLLLPAHHIFEQAEFPRQQLYVPLATAGGPQQQIERERPDAQYGLPRLRRTAQQRLDARDKLDQGKGLGEIIVTTHAQTAHAFVDPPERTEYQDRRGLPIFA